MFIYILLVLFRSNVSPGRRGQKGRAIRAEEKEMIPFINMFGLNCLHKDRQRRWRLFTSLYSVGLVDWSRLADG